MVSVIINIYPISLVILVYHYFSLGSLPENKAMLLNCGDPFFPARSFTNIGQMGIPSSFNGYGIYVALYIINNQELAEQKGKTLNPERPCYL